MEFVRPNRTVGSVAKGIRELLALDVEHHQKVTVTTTLSKDDNDNDDGTYTKEEEQSARSSLVLQ